MQQQQQPAEMPQQSQPVPPPIQNHENLNNKHELELVLTKLDLLKSTLQNIDARLSNIEQKVYEEKNERRTW